MVSYITLVVFFGRLSAVLIILYPILHTQILYVEAMETSSFARLPLKPDGPLKGIDGRGFRGFGAALLDSYWFCYDGTVTRSKDIFIYFIGTCTSKYHSFLRKVPEGYIFLE